MKHIHDRFDSRTVMPTSIFHFYSRGVFILLMLATFWFKAYSKKQLLKINHRKEQTMEQMRQQPTGRREEGISEDVQTEATTDVDLDEIDTVLDEIDEVLEENTADFVDKFVQRGGQ